MVDLTARDEVPSIVPLGNTPGGFSSQIIEVKGKEGSERRKVAKEVNGRKSLKGIGLVPEEGESKSLK